MAALTNADKSLLEILQKDIALDSRPYQAIADELRTTESEVIRSTNGLLAACVIREISAFVNMTKIGFKSTLVALRVQPDSLEEAVARINAHPGVSHNYMREHAYNVWFTLTVRRECDFKAEIERLFEGLTTVRYLILPSLAVFKIEVNFRFSEKPETAGMHRREESGDPVTLSAVEKRVLARAAENFPVVSRPWQAMADELSMPADSLLDTIRSLKDKGVIKRISAALRHRNAGFVNNGMVCFKLPEDMILAAGHILAGFAEVSHCYQRPVFPDWPYGLFAMVHTQSRADCEAIIGRMASSIKCGDYITLYSSKELKKEKIRLQGILK